MKYGYEEKCNTNLLFNQPSGARYRVALDSFYLQIAFGSPNRFTSNVPSRVQQRGINGECGKTHLWLEKMLKLLFFVRLHCDINVGRFQPRVEKRMKKLIHEGQ